MPDYANDFRFYATLSEALQTLTVGRLKSLAALLSDGKQPVRKAELIQLIERRLDGAGLHTVWERLDKTQKAAVAEAVHGDDAVFQAERFVAKYGKSPDWGETAKGWVRMRNPSLMEVFFIDDVMPQDLRHRLAAFVPEPEETRLRYMDEPPEGIVLTFRNWTAKPHQSNYIERTVPLTYRDMERAAIHDLQTMLQAIDAGKVAVSDKTRLPGKATTRAIAALLLDGDFYDGAGPEAAEVGPVRAFAWPLLVQAGGLAAPGGSTLALTRAGRKALGEPPENVLRTLWDKWQKTTLLDELSRIDRIKGQTGKGKRGLTAVKSRRPAINAALRDCEPQRWIAVDDFFRYMLASGIDFQVTRNPWGLYVADAQYGSLGYQGFHDWNILQGRYALCLLFEYAATLGLMDVAYVPPHSVRSDYHQLWGTDELDFFSRYDGLLYFRLTPLGAYCLNLTGHYQPATPAPQARLQVLPNRDVVVVGEPLSPADELLLSGFAARKSDAVWHLDRAGLLAALEEGRDVATLRGFLEGGSADPLPETVEQFLQDTEQRAHQLRDSGPARLIECADPTLAALIANDSRTRRYCLLAGERHLAVFSGNETRFRSALRKLGYTLPK